MSDTYGIDSNGYKRILKVDDHGNIITIDFVHHEIHEGDHFTVTDYDSDVDTAAPKR